jgi:hypothetical protein
MNEPRPFVIAKNGRALDVLLQAIHKNLNDVRLLTREEDLHGHFNTTLYVGHGADRKLVDLAHIRGFKIEEVDT